ncbi:MAG: hypothetical protein LUE13_06315 [Akkermansiaceae bacterium]|nr:hypothetical protein [Akkermansiaceae bacterium]
MVIGITFAKMRLHSILKRIDQKETTSVPNGFSHEFLILNITIFNQQLFALQSLLPYLAGPEMAAGNFSVGALSI